MVRDLYRPRRRRYSPPVRIYHGTLAEDYSGLGAEVQVDLSSASPSVAPIEIAPGDRDSGQAIPEYTQVAVMSLNGRLFVQSLGANDAMLLCDDFDRTLVPTTITPAEAQDSDNPFSLGQSEKNWSWGLTYVKTQATVEIADGILKLSNSDAVSFYVSKSHFETNELTFRFRFPAFVNGQELQFHFDTLTETNRYTLKARIILSLTQISSSIQWDYDETAKVSFAITAGDWWLARWQNDFADHSYFKIWKEGDAEPDWQVKLEDFDDPYTGILGTEELSDIGLGVAPEDVDLNLRPWNLFSLHFLDPSTFGSLELDYIRTGNCEQPAGV